MSAHFLAQLELFCAGHVHLKSEEPDGAQLDTGCVKSHLNLLLRAVDHLNVAQGQIKVEALAVGDFDALTIEKSELDFLGALTASDSHSDTYDQVVRFALSQARIGL